MRNIILKIAFESPNGVLDNSKSHDIGMATNSSHCADQKSRIDGYLYLDNDETA